jgi:hypothetical protein
VKDASSAYVDAFNIGCGMLRGASLISRNDQT